MRNNFMEVILLQRLKKLGQIGDVVSVKPGFARNYLLPKGKALRATDINKSIFESQRKNLEADDLNIKNDATDIASRMKNMMVPLIRQAGESGQLYGSVNSRDISLSVNDAGVKITRQQVDLSKPIKSLGIHNVNIHLHPEVSVSIAINVARSLDEAKTQAKTGRAIMTSSTEIEPESSVTSELTQELFEEGADQEALSNLTDESQSNDDVNTVSMPEIKNDTEE